MLTCCVLVANTVVCVVHMMDVIVSYGRMVDIRVYVVYDVYDVSSLLVYVILPLFM